MLQEDSKVVVGFSRSHPEAGAGGRRGEGGSRQSSPLPGGRYYSPAQSQYAIYAAVALHLPTVSAGGPKPLLRPALTP